MSTPVTWKPRDDDILAGSVTNDEAKTTYRQGWSEDVGVTSAHTFLRPDRTCRRASKPIATRLLVLLRRCSLLPALALGVASRIGAQTVAPAAAYSFVTCTGASRASMRVAASEARPFD